MTVSYYNISSNQSLDNEWRGVQRRSNSLLGGEENVPWRN